MKESYVEENNKGIKIEKKKKKRKKNMKRERKREGRKNLKRG